MQPGNRMKRYETVSNVYKSLLQANEAALRESTTDAVFRSMCCALRNIVPHDRAELTLYDHDQHTLRFTALYGAYENSSFHVGDVLGGGDAQDDSTFTNRRSTTRRNLRKNAQFHWERQTAQEGFQSLCSVPLTLRGNTIGVVTLIGVRKNQFTVRHAELLRQMCNQITLAISAFVPRCIIHPKAKLLCPGCIGAAGAKVTASRHRGELSNWGRKGGRSRRNKDVL
jgi:transcriptional regulator with GAF, ATPase, and Fis domain